MLELMGHVGSVFLMVCGLPQLYRTIVTKNVESLSLVSLLFWSAGCVFMGLYVLFTTAQLPLLINYGFNAIVVSLNVILYCFYKKSN